MLAAQQQNPRALQSTGPHARRRLPRGLVQHLLGNDRATRPVGQQGAIGTHTRAGLDPAAHMIKCIGWQRHTPPVLVGVEFPPIDSNAAGPQPT